MVVLAALASLVAAGVAEAEAEAAATVVDALAAEFVGVAGFAAELAGAGAVEMVDAIHVSHAAGMKGA